MNNLARNLVIAGAVVTLTGMSLSLYAKGAHPAASTYCMTDPTLKTQGGCFGAYNDAIRADANAHDAVSLMSDIRAMDTWLNTVTTGRGSTVQDASELASLGEVVAADYETNSTALDQDQNAWLHGMQTVEADMG